MTGSTSISVLATPSISFHEGMSMAAVTSTLSNRCLKDGTKVFFETDEALVAEDTDGQWDLYERSGSNTTLITVGAAGDNDFFEPCYTDIAFLTTCVSASDDGSRVSSTRISSCSRYRTRTLTRTCMSTRTGICHRCL